MDKEKRKFLKQLTFGFVGLIFLKVFAPLGSFTDDLFTSKESVNDMKVKESENEHSFYNKEGKKVLVVKK